MNKTIIYGTIGPSCASVETLKTLLKLGMNGMRLNLSHSNLNDVMDWLLNYQQAQKELGINADLIIDMQGPELRTGDLKTQKNYETNQTYTLDLPLPEEVYNTIETGDILRFDDDAVILQMINNKECKVLKPGVLKAHKSLTIENKTINLPVFTPNDIENLKVAKKYGVTGIMQPFVRSVNDLKTIKQTLSELNLDLKVFAKIESLEGVQQCKTFLPYCDVIVIARGDLGMAMPLSKLPRIQKELSKLCNTSNFPFMVVTQMLHSMHTSATPTRAEVSDIFNAVLDGASYIMLTGETASGNYPVEAMKYFIETAKEAKLYQEAD